MCRRLPGEVTSLGNVFAAKRVPHVPLYGHMSAQSDGQQMICSVCVCVCVMPFTDPHRLNKWRDFFFPPRWTESVWEGKEKKGDTELQPDKCLVHSAPMWAFNQRILSSAHLHVQKHRSCCLNVSMKPVTTGRSSTRLSSFRVMNWKWRCSTEFASVP